MSNQVNTPIQLMVRFSFIAMLFGQIEFSYCLCSYFRFYGKMKCENSHCLILTFLQSTGRSKETLRSGFLLIQKTGLFESLWINYSVARAKSRAWHGTALHQHGCINPRRATCRTDTKLFSFQIRHGTARHDI